MGAKLGLTLREELRVFENRVLRRIFGPNRDEVTGDWRKLHNEELHNLYSSPSTASVLASFFIYFNLHSGGWNQGPLDTAAT
jgi:hypothetical protein